MMLDVVSRFGTAARRAGRSLLAAGALASAAALAAAPSVASSGPPVTTFTLDNGMRAVVIQDHRTPVVTHMVWYAVGAADEPPGKSGIAHYLEHLMFKGTDTIPPGEFSKIIAANGGQDNAFTSLDYTGYFQRVAADRLSLVMEMEADRMVNLRLTEEQATTERDVVIEERNSRTDNDPQSQFYEELLATFYRNHGYGVPVIGWRREIETLSLEDALDFYDRFYGPETALLVVAGDVTPDEVKALAEEHYGVIEPRGVAAQPRPQEPPHRAAREVSMSSPLVRQPFVTRLHPAPSYVTAEPGEAEALALMSQILGGGVTSRLSQRLVIGDAVALNAGSYYSGVSRDDTTFGWYAVPVDGVDLDALVGLVEEEITRLGAEGPTEEELERAKTVLISSSIYRQDSQSSMARMYGLALTVGLDVEDVQNWPDAIRAVTPGDVAAAAGRLDPTAAVTGFLTSAPAAD